MIVLFGLMLLLLVVATVFVLIVSLLVGNFLRNIFEYTEFFFFSTVLHDLSKLFCKLFTILLFGRFRLGLEA